MQTFLKFYLPLLGLLSFAAVFLLPVWRTYKQTGKNPIAFNREDNAHNFVSRALLFLVLGTTLTLLTFCFSYQTYLYLVPITYLQHIQIFMTGLCITHIALILTMVAQYQMKSSWRIGIDKATLTPLVAGGLFRFSRNPIYTSMLFSMTGFFMMMPNALSFSVLITGLVLINIQVRLEEEFLEKIHGANYQEYKKKVPRFILLK